MGGGWQEKQGPRPFYMVKTHGANVSFLDAVDMLTISDFHHMLLTRAVQNTGLTVSPPYPLMTSQVLIPLAACPLTPPPTHIYTHPSIPLHPLPHPLLHPPLSLPLPLSLSLSPTLSRRRDWESESRTRSTAGPRTPPPQQTSCGS